MSTQTENSCLRCRTDCTPASNISSDNPAPGQAPASFICVGWNTPQSRTIHSDRFTLCWKNAAIDERGHWDKRDLLDTMSVIAQALSTDENIRVNEGTDEQGMQDLRMI